jgi:pyruvate dehydrogenase E2 component (dihydrolipoamide acetyltransferase)
VAEEANMSELMRLRENAKWFLESDTGIKPTYTDLLIKLLAKCLKEHPDINAFWTEEGIRVLSEINIGVATNIPGGLVVPVIRNVVDKSIAEIVRVRADLVKRAREGKITPDEIKGSTFTLNNVGTLGLRSVHAIINPPESAILTIGRIEEKAIVVSGQIQIRPMAELVLSADHRALDGNSAGRFLLRIRQLIENPLLLAV